MANWLVRKADLIVNSSLGVLAQKAVSSAGEAMRWICWIWLIVGRSKRDKKKISIPDMSARNEKLDN